MKVSRFEEQYKKLNPEQRQAVDAIEGPVVVVAGPGTGKTSVLTLRIANILRKTDTRPENILALTFTESGVHSMRKKLVDLIGVSGYQVSIHTFHGFCNDIIKNFPQEFPRIIGAQHVTDIDQINILEKIITGSKLEILKPSGNPLYYIKPALSFIKELKREDVSPEYYLAQVQGFERELGMTEDFRHEKGIHKGEIRGKYKPVLRKIAASRELCQIYKKYQKSLAEMRLYDYEDMIVEVLRELRENQDLLLELQETYQYIMADEHQDANRSQNILLELLSGFHEQPNLFVVGDENQAIFRFQGASLENFLYFKNKFPKAVVVPLKINYRSTQSILDAAHSLIEKNPNQNKPKLQSVNVAKGDRILVGQANSYKDEVMFIVRDIRQELESGTPAEEIAVLFRDNRDAELIARIFDLENLPYAIHADIDVISDEYINRLVMILGAINDFGNDEFLAKILFLDIFALNHLDVFKVLKYCRDRRKSLAAVIKNVAELGRAEVENPSAFIDFYKNLEKLSVSAKNKNLLDSLQDIVRYTGFITFLLSQPKSLDLLASYDVFISHVGALAERHKSFKLGDYLEILGRMTTHGLGVRSKGSFHFPGRVNLMTAHKSKGLEFDRVYCLHLNDGKWSGRRGSQYFLPVDARSAQESVNEISDERRLFYVALTRARKSAVLTFASQEDSGRELLPSQFIGEIDEALLSLKKFESAGLAYAQTGAGPGIETVDFIDKEYISKLFIDQGLSVSALNNYLTCPWQFFFVNLIRIPKFEERHQLYGTSIHESLKYFFDAYKEERKISKKELIEYFENSLRRKAISEHDFELFLERGRKALGGYYDNYKNSWSRNILNEFKISGVDLPIRLDDGEIAEITLRGQLDKIEFLPKGGINVVDYKTGQPKSRRDIEGETKSSDGNYKRQLAFYKLLADGHNKSRLEMKTGEIDFIEPNKQGRYRKEKFEVREEEVEELIKTIAKMSDEVLGLKFWNQTCLDEKCEFCELRKILFSRKATQTSS